MEGKLECEKEQQDGQSLVPSKLEPHKNSIQMKDDTTILLFPPSGSFPFNAGPRPYRDSVVTFLFLGTIFTTYGFGLFAFAHADFNLDSKLLHHSKFNPNTNQCDLVHAENSELLPQTSLLLPTLLPKLRTDFCVLVITVPFGMLFVWLLHRYTRGFLLVAALLVPLSPLAFGLTLCYGEDGICTAAKFPLLWQMLFMVFPLAMSGLLFYKLRKKWSRASFESIIQVLKTATDALTEHYFVLILNPILFLGSMVLVNGPICSFIWYAFNNGKIVPDFDVIHDPSKGCDQAMRYPCCKEQWPGWLAAYVTLACFTLIWVLTVTFQLQILIVNSTAAQWYSAPERASTRFGIIKRSLRNAFRPSFGTACNMGIPMRTLVTTLVVKLVGSGLVKKMASRFANGNRQAGVISIILHRCFSWTVQFSEPVSEPVSEGQPKFASNFAAISGESFWVSSVRSQSLLRRNSLPTMGTDVALLTVQVLSGMLVTYAFLLTFLVYGVLEYFTNSHPKTITSSFNTIMIGLLQFFLAIGAVINTLYICYAMEKDVGAISKPEVCHVYTLRCPPSQSENESFDI